MRHWLYGEVNLAVIIEAETDCSTCNHKRVCNRDTSVRCSNYEYGGGADRGCQSCAHRFTRFDTKKINCFHCPDWQTEKERDG